MSPSMCQAQLSSHLHGSHGFKQQDHDRLLSTEQAGWPRYSIHNHWPAWPACFSSAATMLSLNLSILLEALLILR